MADRSENTIPDPKQRTAELEQRIAELEQQILDLKRRHAGDLLQASGNDTIYQALLETVPVGVVIAGPQGDILHGNSCAEEMVRHPIYHSKDAESYGEWIAYHADGRQVESHEYPLARIILDGEDHAQLDVQYQRGDGTRFWMRIIGQPVRNEDEERIGAIVALLDIDAEYQLTQQKDLLIAELNHRVKNAFAVSQAIVGRILRSNDASTQVIDDIDQRLKAYATAHAKLVGTDFTNVSIEAIAHDVFQALAPGRVEMEGPDLVVPSRNGLALSMAFYELTTNAVKHGSLSWPEGKVRLTWHVEDVNGQEHWLLRWKEVDGPAPAFSGHKGFGTFIIGRALMMETRGRTEMEYAEDGFEWSLCMPRPEKPEIA